MIRLITIGTDRKVFEEGSAVRARLLRQRELFSELHVIVFSRQSDNLRVQQIGNLWLYPTSSLSKILYVKDAVSLATGLVLQRAMVKTNSVISAQDPFECGLAGYFSSKRGGDIPLHIQIHTDFLSPEFAASSFLNRARVFISRFVLTHARGIRVVSNRIKESLESSTIKTSATVEVLPVFSEHAITWAEKSLRRFKKNALDSALVFMAARFAPEKDFSTALRALELGRMAGGVLGLVIVGEGSLESRIRDEIVARGLQDAVKIELWQSDLSSLYRVEDIVLLTSRFEGYGLVLLEAAIHGQPIVTTDVGIARELILAPYERFICPVGDYACIGRALLELSSNPLLRKEYGNALRTVAKKKIIPAEEYWKKYQLDLERCVIMS